jgi:predicted glycoside hydrolase/deacetylase ChbG (UPF0249 family)
MLRKDFALVFQAQLDEYLRIMGEEPSHMDGHQHLHLCTNMMFQTLIRRGTKVRRSFSFRSGEKSSFNRAYRAWVDRRLAKRHRLTDHFFALPEGESAIAPLLEVAGKSAVELMVHPQREQEYEFLVSEDFGRTLGDVRLEPYSAL